MKNVPSAVAILGLSLAAVISIDEPIATKVWFVSFACFLILVGLAQADARNWVGLNVSRWFPAVTFACYIGAVGLNMALLQDYFAVYIALYAAMVCVALADYAGQLVVGTHIIMLMGRNHLGRSGQLKRESQYHY